MAGLCEGGNKPPGSLKATGRFGPVLWIEFGVAQWSERLLVVITEDVQNVHLLLEYRPHIDVSLTCEHDPKLQEYCVCPQNMPQFDSEGIPNQAPETNKPMILNGPTSRNLEGSDQLPRIDGALVTRGIDGGIFLWLKMEQIQARELRTDAIDLKRVHRNITERRRGVLVHANSVRPEFWDRIDKMAPDNESRA
ncbi:hypothetical protein ANN_17074 [Periplaneta americana]|uniref:Uncharacterized protein n=1 Tax=Periplaneta americana TaxID=6978 RepID=A0ABQ8STC4_PERAM|nr:hypothetical protein ANN_17074 [Periplaneta americana]